MNPKDRKVTARNVFEKRHMKPPEQKFWELPNFQAIQAHLTMNHIKERVIEFGVKVAGYATGFLIAYAIWKLLGN